jgi:hypothetical protein
VTDPVDYLGQSTNRTKSRANEDDHSHDQTSPNLVDSDSGNDTNSDSGSGSNRDNGSDSSVERLTLLVNYWRGKTAGEAHTEQLPWEALYMDLIEELADGTGIGGGGGDGDDSEQEAVTSEEHSDRGEPGRGEEKGTIRDEPPAASACNPPADGRNHIKSDSDSGRDTSPELSQPKQLTLTTVDLGRDFKLDLASWQQQRLPLSYREALRGSLRAKPLSVRDMDTSATTPPLDGIDAASQSAAPAQTQTQTQVPPRGPDHVSDSRMHPPALAKELASASAPAVLFRLPRSVVSDFVSFPENLAISFQSWQHWGILDSAGTVEMKTVSLPDPADVPEDREIVEWAQSWRERMPGWDDLAAEDILSYER